MKLADNVLKAMRLMTELKEIEQSLPGLDCGICGAPSCRALADDIVRGYAEKSDCVFSALRSKGDDSWIPAPFRADVRTHTHSTDDYAHDFERAFLQQQDDQTKPEE